MGGHHVLPSWEQCSILVYRHRVCSLITMPHQGNLEEEDAELRRVQRIKSTRSSRDSLVRLKKPKHKMSQGS